MTAAGVMLLTACTTTPPDATQSAPTTTVASTDTTATPMSGGYEVDADGHLVKPHRALTTPTLSTTATANTPDGAQAFARHFVAVTQYAWNTGDTTPLQDISTHDCQMCQSMIQAIEAAYSGGGWSDQTTYVVTATETPTQVSAGSSDKLAVVMHVTTDPGVTYYDEKISRGEMARELIELHTCWMHTSWRACGGVGATDPDAT